MVVLLGRGRGRSKVEIARGRALRGAFSCTSHLTGSAQALPVYPHLTTELEQAVGSPPVTSLLCIPQLTEHRLRHVMVQPRSNVRSGVALHAASFPRTLPTPLQHKYTTRWLIALHFQRRCATIVPNLSSMPGTSAEHTEIRQWN